MTVNPEALQAIFNHVEEGKHLTKQELQILVEAARSQQITIAAGKRTSAIGGSADGAVIITGDKNIILQGIDAKSLKVALQSVSRETREVKRSRNEQLLLNEVKQEVTSRLQQSLFDAVLIELRKQQLFQQVKRPWDAEVKIGVKPSLPIPDDVNILEIFEHPEISGKLLILGAPGIGKTTTQLNLAKALIRFAEQQEDFPIPVLFSLPSWQDNRQPISEWLVAELQSKYGVRPKIGKKWIESRKLLPLLDGLDELEVTRQEPCVQAINAFIQGDYRPQYLVVCSRVEEYGKYSTRLQLNGAICLQPLTVSQIRDYLTAVKHPELWQIIIDDPNLLELSRVPLLLSVLILTYKDIALTAWKQFNSPQELLRYILNVYIEQMLSRSISRNAYGEQRTPTSNEAKQWLSWLARQLQRRSQVEFLIEEMQPSILLTNTERRIHTVFCWSIVALLVTLLIALKRDSAWIILGGLTSIAFIGLSRRMTYDIQPVETLVWSPDGAKTGWIIGLMVGLGLGSNFGWMLGGTLISTLFYGVACAIVLGLISALIIGLTYTLIGEFSEPDIKTEKFPNQGIWNSLKNAGIAGLVGACVSGLVGFLILGLFEAPVGGLLFGLKLGAMTGIMFGGGIACIQHFSLRIFLYRKRAIPWNYARFLSYATARLFLQQIGGRYRFIHRLLQEHFAKLL